MNYRTARALYPNRLDLEAPAFIVEPLPLPAEHPELPLWESEEQGAWRREPATTEALTPSSTPRGPVSFTDPIPARMLNEFVYCQRLFYYEFVDGVFVENADTERGSALHEKVDRGRGDLPKANKKKQGARGAEHGELALESGTATAPGIALEDEQGEPVRPDPSESESIAPSGDIQDQVSSIQPPDTDIIHSRSASLSSERLGVVAKMDLVEVKVAKRDPQDFFSTREVLGVTPVDYKAGAPRPGEDANELWPTDKMQLGLQILILRDNGYVCDDGIIYYRATKQRVRLIMTPEIEAWIIERITAARKVAAQQRLPPPLVNSPKCVRCSLAPVCLPDETRLLRTGARTLLSAESPSAKPTAPASVPRRLIAARDEERALYLNTPGLRINLKSEILVVKDADRVVDEIRLSDVSHVALFGNIQITTQAVQELCEQEIPLAYFSMGGWFYGLTRGHGLKNVFTRIEQFRAADDEARCLALARRMVQGKIKNQRTMLMRLHVDAPAAVVQQLKEQVSRVMSAGSLGELLGMEGAAAAVYFQHFAGMIKVCADDDEIPGLESPASVKAKNEFTFDFTKRTRRPPTDPVNALLSLAYSLLAKDCTIAALAVGFDPYIGFYHQPRFGRPALALDLMEEFRPLIAESAVLTAINNRMITPGHFVRVGDAINLTPAGRKVFFQAYEQRMNALITHPVFDYKVSYRRVLELQARLLASHLTGEIPDYVPMVTR
ncbi:MAG: CRISPR-associated endonuclease Cas1 [Verrucomicrobiaceae bacterium]|nr:CRISPR-associated endonuclease Cas1 [Verrucomicrobiaceae bacterium]